MRGLVNSRFGRWGLIALLGVIGVAGLGAVGAHLAAKALKAQFEQALGPESEVGEIRLHWTRVEVRNLRLKAPSGWPTADTLRARRIVVEPDLRSLLSHRIHIHRIAVESPYLSLLRAREGKLRLVPSLIEKPATEGGKPPEVTIDRIDLEDASVDFFDATVSQPPHRLRLAQVEAGVDDLHLPDLDRRMTIRINGVMPSVQRNGSFALDGWLEIAGRNSQLETKLRGVDLVALQPYLVKAADTGVKQGALDLDLDSVVRKNRLHAPGTATLTDLELSSQGGGFGTFMGLPRQAVVGAMKDRDGKIAVKFALDGNLDDPRFSLNENLATRFGTSVADSLGVSIAGLAQGVGSAAQGVGGTLKRLFGGGKQ